MGENEFLVLRRGVAFLGELVGPECPIDKSHRHRLALELAADETVSARELGRNVAGAVELVDHLAFGQRNRSEWHREAELLRHELNLDRTEADLADEGMGTAEAALRRVGKAEQK